MTTSEDPLYTHIFSQRMEVKTIQRSGMVDIIEKLLHGDRLTDLGKEVYRDIIDALIIRNPPNDVFLAPSALEAASVMETVTADHGETVGYLTGGLELSLHHLYFWTR